MQDLTKMSDKDLIKSLMTSMNIVHSAIEEQDKPKSYLGVDLMFESCNELKSRLARLREYEADYEAAKERCYNRGFVEGVKMERERKNNARPEQDE